MHQLTPPYTSVDESLPRGSSPSELRFPEPQLNILSPPRGESIEPPQIPKPGKPTSRNDVAPSRGKDRPDAKATWTTLTCSRYSVDNFIVRDSNENILYWVENTHEHTFHANPIKVFKPDPRENNYSIKVLYATMILNRLDPCTLEIPKEGKKNIALDGVFRPKPWPSRSRLMTTEYGEWKWAYDSDNPQLWDENRKLVLKYGNNQRTSSSNAPPELSLHPKCIALLDTIILGLIVELYDIDLRKKTHRY